MERKQIIAIIILVFFIAFAIFLAIKSDDIASSMKNGDNFIVNLLYSYLLNPANILILVSIVYLNRNKGVFKSLIASFLIIFAITAVSFPHIVTKSGLPQEVGAWGSSDTIIIAGLNNLGLKHPYSFYTYYVVLPVLSLFLALYLLGFKAFTSKILNGGG